MKLLLTSMMTLLMVSFVAFNTSAQNEITTHRKVVRLLKAEHDIYNLGFDKNYVETTILPEVEQNKSLLAPHYPELLTNNPDDKYAALSQWIEEYQNEYEAFATYYETLVRSYL